jgi:hypothetical protein
MGRRFPAQGADEPPKHLSCHPPKLARAVVILRFDAEACRTLKQLCIHRLFPGLRLD